MVKDALALSMVLRVLVRKAEWTLVRYVMESQYMRTV